MDPLVYNGDVQPNPGWIASIVADGDFTCTGSLVHPRWVLTAAHCVDVPAYYEVFVGDDRWYQGVRREVVEIRLHPEYTSDPTSVDLALLRLSQPVEATWLPLLAQPGWPVFAQALALVGWGLTSTYSETPDLLQSAGVYVTSDSTGVADDRYCYRVWVAESGYEDFCFGGPVYSWACSGDSGGPLVGWDSPELTSGPVRTIYGVVSYGEAASCSLKGTVDDIGQPVGPHRNWITNLIDNWFIDDDTSVFEADIEWIASIGITRGCNPPVNDRYCPTDLVTRGEMAAFLRRALRLPEATRDFFIDDETSVFESDINALAAAGVTKGCNPPANDRYCPDRNVDRGAMAAFLNRAFDFPDPTRDYFTDDETSVFEGDINTIAAAGVTRGCDPPDNTLYCPTAPVDRGAMAAFLHRAMAGD